MECWQPLPSEFIERIKNLYPEKAERILETFCHKRPTTFRANTLKITPEVLKKELTRDGFEVDSVPWLPTAFILKTKSLYELTQHPLYIEGKLYVQSLSSMIPPLVLDPQPGDAILDIAAAPGSKTAQMAMMMNNQGSILANDTSLVRLFKLQANLKMQGVEIVKTLRGQGQQLWQQYPEVFDKALVDVPCSMEGRFFTESPKTFTNWNPKKNKELALRQRALLRSAVSATKPDGVIVYSTCTLSPEENEIVIDWLLKKEKGSVVVESTHLEHLPIDPALLQWKHKMLDPQIAQTFRILPSELMEGFYVAKLRKIRSTLTY